MIQPRSRRKIRYAVVGVGNIAQVAVLPAFAQARENSELATFFHGDPAHRDPLLKKYRLKAAYAYGDFEKGLEEQQVDAVYIALPNHLHCEYAVRAARAGAHVLCEKPLSVTRAEARKIIDAAHRYGVKLMTAYRLHFERANLSAVELVRSGKLGDPRLFSSVFTMQVREGDIRTKRAMGGGTVYDIGVYCINAARSFFQAEPVEAFAFTARRGGDRRFREIDEMTGALLRFPGERLAAFTTSFGAADESCYEVVGTEGKLVVENGYDYTAPPRHALTVGGKTRVKTFARRDQFAPELLYFSRCILEDLEPEPSGMEGLIDVEIVEALYRSAREGRPIPLRLPKKRLRPRGHLRIDRPRIRPPRLVAAPPPSR
ncbi:MAG: Gfo/Idh/MocA family oxidoreductase [Verrucomicrobium sp.]|nr:Gfo/Idh/MocA family oxidoreductase [Verrucomicrobium sp.]